MQPMPVPGELYPATFQANLSDRDAGAVEQRPEIYPGCLWTIRTGSLAAPNNARGRLTLPRPSTRFVSAHGLFPWQTACALRRHLALPTFPERCL